MRDELYAMSSVMLNDIAMLRSEKIKVVEVIDDIRGCNMMYSNSFVYKQRQGLQ